MVQRSGPTKRPQYMRISRLITVTYLLFHVHVLQWDVANPRTTKPFSNNWFCNLHGCRNLSREAERQRLGLDGLVAFSKDIERIPSHCFSLRVINQSRSGSTGVFFARKMHSTSEFAMTVLSKCVFVCAWNF